MTQNIFADEWRDCLRAHYMHVIRAGDQTTEPTLRVVMHDAGFTDDELALLRVQATMHVDDVGADFVPDLHALDAQPTGDVFYSVPPEAGPAPEAETAAAGEQPAPADDDSDEPDPDSPQQLSLF